MSKKYFKKINRYIPARAIFCILFSISLYTEAESVIKDKDIDDLTIYNPSKGFYEVPSSTNVVPVSEKTVNYATMALGDTMVLQDESSDTTGVSIYKLSTGMAVVHAAVGNGNSSSYSVVSFGIGDFTIIKTLNEYECSELTLSQCGSVSGYLNQKLFSVTYDGISTVDNSDVAKSAIVATTTNSTSTATAVSIPEIEISKTSDGILVLSSTSNPVATTTIPTVLFDNINPAGSTLVLPFQEEYQEVNLNTESLFNNTVLITPMLTENSVIQSDYSDNQEIKNENF